MFIIKKLIIIFILLFSHFVCVWSDELRGVWIHSPTSIIDHRGWDATVRVLAENGFNALFANFAWAGCAEYPSGVVAPHPSLYDRDGNSHDRLQECLDACRKYGIQLHVWIVACNLGERTPASVTEQFREEGRLQLDSAGQSATYLAPHLKENQRLLVELASEVVSSYPVDGLHLDYIRYPGIKYDFSPSARAAFEQSVGHPVANWPSDCQSGGIEYESFLQWRRDNITALVRQVRDAVKALRPEVQLTAAVYGYWPSARVGIAQDAACWAEERLVDALCPMNYSPDPWEAGAWLRQQLRVVDGRVPIYTGLANYKTTVPEDLEAQIVDARTCGADGFITFQLRPDFANHWLPELHETVTGEPAAAPIGNIPLFQATWSRPPIQLPWRFLRFWRRGDCIKCVIRQQAASQHDSCKTLKFSLLHNGVKLIDWSGSSSLLQDGSWRLEFMPERRGYYRWEIQWTDSAGQNRTWRSSSRFVY